MSGKEIYETDGQEILFPGRPIVLLGGTCLHNIGHYIDWFLVPLLRNNIYIKKMRQISLI